MRCGMSKEKIPDWFLRFLRWFCPPQLLEEIEGDLLQKYERDCKMLGEGRASRKLFWRALRFFRPGIVLRNKFLWKLNPFHMLPHFFKVFIRTSRKYAGYSLINMSGLAVGLACSLFAGLWILDELAFDRFHQDKERIFSIRTHATYGDGIFTFNNTPGPLAEGLKEFPEVEEACRSTFNGRTLIANRDKSFFEAGIYADASLFRIFTLPLTEGEADHLLDDVNSIVLSETLAKKYFGNKPAIGNVLKVDNATDVRVTAVMQDLPPQSTLQFQFVLPYSLYAKSDPYNQEWGAWTGGDTYVKLRDGIETKSLEKKISAQLTHPKIWPRWGDNVELALFSLKDWRLRDFENGKLSEGRSASLRAFGLVALFILLIASVNFMNLATARSINRAKEIGVRKVIGAVRSSLRWQFTGESILLSFASMLAGLGIVHLALPAFNALTDKKIFIDYGNPLVLLAVPGIALITGLLAGSYPAFFLSSLQAINVLKGKLSGTQGAGLRKTLVVFQFSLSVVLVISALVVYRQIDYMRNKNLGFDKENVFYFRASGKAGKNYDVLREELMSAPGIRSVSRASEEPMNIQQGLELADDAWRGKTKEDNIAFSWLFCDADFLKAFHFDLADGRNFSATNPADSNNFIISQEAARRMRIPQPVGEPLKVDRKGVIVGVVKNFNSLSLKLAMQPVIISMRPERASRIFIHYEKGQLSAVLNHAQAVYQKLEPDFPMEVTFLDDSFNKLYQDEILTGRLAACFTAIAVFISCLGLFGLSSFMAERRIREIGIRKILGATVSQLVSLLSRDFMILVAVALTVGFPIAWWACNLFLQKYAFRVDIGASTFVIAGVSLVTLSLMTVAWQSVRAALTNPVNNLRTE